MRSARGDVRDHIVSHRNDHRPPYLSYRSLRRRRPLKIDIRAIFGVARFSTFATVSARSRHCQVDTAIPLTSAPNPGLEILPSPPAGPNWQDVLTPRKRPLT